MTSAFEIEEDAANAAGKTKILLHRKLDYEQGELVCQRLKELVLQGHGQWEIDIANVDYCDSITLGFLIMMHTTVKGFKGDIIFKFNPVSRVWQSIKSSHLDRILTLVER